MKELKAYVEGIKADLLRLYEVDYTDDEREQMEADGESYDLYSYFSDCLDVEYTISSRGDLLGVRAYVALGGPNIWVDTRNGEVAGAWGCDRESAWLPSEICEEINGIFEEWYEMVK